MIKYKVWLKGRKVNSIGKVFLIRGLIVEANDESEVEDILYENFEHISNLIIKRK